MFYEVEYYDKWIPSISSPRIIKYLTKSKKIIYIKFDVPMIQERDALLYSFVNNKLKENKSIQFLCKSADEEEAFKCRDVIAKSDKLIRMDLMNSSFEIKLLDEDRVLLTGFISADARLKGLSENFMQIFIRQYIGKMLSNMQALIDLHEFEFEKIIKKNMSRSMSIDFHNFINREIKKYFKVPNAQEAPA